MTSLQVHSISITGGTNRTKLPKINIFKYSSLFCNKVAKNALAIKEFF